MELKILYEYTSELRPIDIVSLSDGGMLVKYFKETVVVRLDAQLKPVWQKDLGILEEENDRFCLTVSPDERLIGMHGKSVLRIYDMDGNLTYSLDHAPWEYWQRSDCFFSDSLIWFVEPTGEAGGYLHVLSAADFSPIDSFPIDDPDYVFSFYATPEADKVFIDLAAGQDDGHIWEAAVVDGKIVVAALESCLDRIMGAFSPAGNEFVTAPHYDEDIVVYSFPYVMPIASLSQKRLFAGQDKYPAEEPDSVDYVVFYLSGDLLAVRTRWGRILLVDRESMECVGELLLEGCRMIGYDEKGKPTTDPAKTIDYEGRIAQIGLMGADKLVLLYDSKAIRVYQL